MEIKTALILCAGFGKRLKPLTTKKPKPLLTINNITLLEYNLKLLEKLKIKQIKINVFYLEKEIIKYISNHQLKSKIEIFKDGKNILGTGGGIYNIIKSSTDKDFLVFNPDTIWSLDYLDIIKEMVKFYYDNNIQNLLMVVNKKNSYDLRFKGDFELVKNKLIKNVKNNFIYTGCQIINKNLFNDISEINFPISKIWNKQLQEKKLLGFESKKKFIHLADLEIYNKLVKDQQILSSICI